MSRNPLLAVSQWPATYRLLLKSAPIVEALEGLLRRLTRDRTGILDIVGIPSIRQLIPGRRSGIIRPITLQCINGGDGLFVVGSNWGRDTDPAWTANLAACRSVRAQYGGDEYEPEVRVVLGSERSDAWASILLAWPNYELAQRLAPERPFRVFTLTPPTLQRA